MNYARSTGRYCTPVASAFVLLAIATTPIYAADPLQQSGSAPADAPVLERERLLADWGGARTRLEEEGIVFGLTASGDMSANLSGGVRQGRGFSGLIQSDADFDLEKLMGWTGGAFHVGAFLIGGHGLSSYYIGNLMPISSVEADPAGRLGEIYFMQTLAEGALSIKIGQIAADSEFATSGTAGLFVNSAFGWPALNGIVLPGGGPSYPVPTPGVRVAYQLNEAWKVQAGVYSGNPLGQNDRNKHGVTFPLDQGVFAIAEIAYTHSFAEGLSGTYKLGGWYNSRHFEDLRISANGLSLADPDADPDPRRHRGNFALYGVVDQTLWKSPDVEATGHSLAAFARVVVAPENNRSLVNFYADAGVTFTGLLPGRKDDVAGIAVAYAMISPSLRRLDRDTIAFTEEPQPVRSSELVVEASYQAQVAPWLKVQPFVQGIVRPGGGKADPQKPWSKIPNATVFGLRSVAAF